MSVAEAYSLVVAALATGCALAGSRLWRQGSHLDGLYSGVSALGMVLLTLLIGGGAP